MINPFKDVNWQPDIAARRGFGKSLVIGFPIMAAVLSCIVRWNSGAWAEWPITLGSCGVLLGLFCFALPQFALPFYLFWYGLACSIGIVVSNVILAAVYYLTVTPVGLLLRIFGKDPMQRRIDPSAPTYWQDAEKNTPAERYFRQF